MLSEHACEPLAQLNIAIEVLEYFAREAEHELKTGIYQHRPIDPQMAGDIG